MKRASPLFQKLPSRGVFRKRCFENMQQIYRRTLMLKCDFNFIFVTTRLKDYWIRANIFSTSFPENTSGGLLLTFCYLFRACYFYSPICMHACMYKVQCSKLFSSNNHIQGFAQIVFLVVYQPENALMFKGLWPLDIILIHITLW